MDGTQEALVSRSFLAQEPLNFSQGTRLSQVSPYLDIVFFLASSPSASALSSPQNVSSLSQPAPSFFLSVTISLHGLILIQLFPRASPTPLFGYWMPLQRSCVRLQPLTIFGKGGNFSERKWGQWRHHWRQPLSFIPLASWLYTMGSSVLLLPPHNEPS